MAVDNTKRNLLCIVFIYLFPFLSEAGTDSITLQLKWKHQFQFAGFYMALEKGYYRDAGLDVDIREMEINKVAIAELGNGNANYAVVDSGVLLARAAGAPVKVLAAIFQHSPLALIVRREPAMKNIEDLRGKRIMMAPGLNADITAALGTVGISSHGFVRQDTSYDIHDLLNGTTDAFSGYITNQPRQLDLLKAAYRVFRPKEQGIDFYGDVLITTEKEIHEHPKRVRLFTETSMRGWQYALEHIDETIGIILQKYNSQHLSRSQLQFEAQKTKEMILGDVVQVGYMREQRWQYIANVYARQGLLSKDFSVADVIYQPETGLADIIDKYLWQFIIAMLLLFILLLVFHTMRLRRAVDVRTVNLKKSEARFSGIVEMAGDAIISCNEKQEIILFNKAAEMMFGFSQRDILGEHIEELIPKRHRKAYSEKVENFLRDKERHFIQGNRSMSGMRSTGEEFRVESSISKQVLDDGMIMTVMMRDITEKLHAEEAQRKQLIAISEAGEAVMITDAHGIIEYVNPAFSKITGYLSEEVMGKTPAILNSSVQDSSFYKKFWETIKKGEVWRGKLVDKKKDGSFYPALMSVAPIHDDEGKITHFVSLQQDMSAYQKMEEQFLQSQKMEAVGTLVGGIAHDFNNMLAAIQGNVYLSKLKLANQPEVGEKLNNIELLGMRAAEVVKQLLTFARKDMVKMDVFSLNAAIKEAYKLAQATVPENINLACHVCSEDLTVNGDSTQFQQVLMNLLNNARDAVAEVSNPKISCELKLFTVTTEFRKTYLDVDSAKVAKLEVRDNGCGIAKEHLNKIFEPFFTTKHVGAGTGLGLAMVYGSIKSHGGMLEVDSESGLGTVFNIYLPLKEGFEDYEQQENDTVVRGQGETILLVDDEEGIAGATSEVLTSLGYHVLRAVDGEEALEVFKSHQHDIDLVLTDIVMPRMSGDTLAKSIRQLDDAIPVIFMTGYDMQQAALSENQAHQSMIINKPFSVKELSQLVRRSMPLH